MCIVISVFRLHITTSAFASSSQGSLTSFSVVLIIYVDECSTSVKRGNFVRISSVSFHSKLLLENCTFPGSVKINSWKKKDLRFESRGDDYVSLIQYFGFSVDVQVVVIEIVKVIRCRMVCEAKNWLQYSKLYLLNMFLTSSWNAFDDARTSSSMFSIFLAQSSRSNCFDDSFLHSALQSSVEECHTDIMHREVSSLILWRHSWQNKLQRPDRWSPSASSIKKNICELSRHDPWTYRLFVLPLVERLCWNDHLTCRLSRSPASLHHTERVSLIKLVTHRSGHLLLVLNHVCVQCLSATPRVSIQFWSQCPSILGSSRDDLTRRFCA